jgi:hypothetical protein
MTAHQLEPITPAEDQSLARVLRAAHEIWIRETTLFLSPATKEDAGFWERWTAVRYLADQFQGPFHRARAMADEMRPFLPTETGDRLSGEGERIAQLGQALDKVGRRRGTARTVAVASREFLQTLRQWCSDIELAAQQIPREELPEEGARLVTELETYGRTHP